MIKKIKIGTVGDHANFGTITNNNYYSTANQFLQANPQLKLSKTELELVQLIFENTKSEEEREQILTSLRTIKENEGSDGHEESNKQEGGKLKEFLMAVGTGTAAKILAEWGKDLFFHFASTPPPTLP